MTDAFAQRRITSTPTVLAVSGSGADGYSNAIFRCLSTPSYRAESAPPLVARIPTSRAVDSQASKLLGDA